MSVRRTPDPTDGVAVVRPMRSASWPRDLQPALFQCQSVVLEASGSPADSAVEVRSRSAERRHVPRDESTRDKHDDRGRACCSPLHASFRRWQPSNGLTLSVVEMLACVTSSLRPLQVPAAGV